MVGGSVVSVGAALFSEQGLWVVLLGVGLLLPFAVVFYWLLKRGGRGRR